MTAQENLTTIEPVNGPLVGSISVPGDKSISHRAVLFAAMAEGTSRLSGVLDSEDVRSSLGAVSKLGAKVELTTSCARPAPLPLGLEEGQLPE